MSAVIVSYRQCICDGCGRLFPEPDQADDTEFLAEMRAVSEGGWVRDGADVVCHGCSTMHASERPGANQRRQRRAKPGVGV